MIKVSIIIAAYNVEAYIGRCIESIINQTLQEIEIIVVNDGSMDNTLKVINKYKLMDERLVVINKKNGGVQSARNMGIKAAKGNSILLVDGDDWLHNEALYDLYNELEVNNLDIVCYGYYQAIDGEKNREFKPKHIGIYKQTQFLDLVLKNKIIPSLCCKLIKTEFLVSNNIKLPEEIRFGEDLASTVELACHLPKASIINKCYYYYYTRTNSVTNNITDKALDLFKAFEYIKNLLIKNEYYEKFKEEYEFLAYYHLYFERVVGQTNFNKTHKKFYYICKNKKVVPLKNKYLEKFIKNLRFNLKVWLKLYDINYNVAIFIINIWKKGSILKNIKKGYIGSK